MKKWHVFMVLLVLASLLTGCAGTSGGQNPKGEQQTIAVSGAFALYPLMVQWGEEYQAANPNVRIDISAGGAGKGMADALAGAVDIGMVSREISPEEKDQGAYAIAVTRDAVFGTISAQNPYLADLQRTGITKETLAGIFLTGEITTWGQVIGKPEVTDEIHVYTRSDACGAAEMWVKYVGGKKQEELKGIGVNADPGVLEAVIKDPLSIGYNNLNYAFDTKSGLPVAGAAVLSLDVNANGQVDPDELVDTKTQAVDAVTTNRYPSPPARPLYLVTKGKPTSATLDLITWILADGQKFVDAAGYVKLSEEQLLESQAQLK